MNVFMHILTIIVSFVVGLFGFSQIVGSIQWANRRGIPMTLFTMALWIIILVAYVFAVLNWFPAYKMTAFVILGISFLLSLRHQE